MKRNIFALLLSAAITFCSVATLTACMNPFASSPLQYEEIDEGGGVVYERVSFNSYCANDSSITEIEIPAEHKGHPVKKLWGFRNAKYLEKIVLPETLESIGENSFSDCTALRSVNFPEGLKSIARSAFSGCTSLQSIELPGAVGVMERAFEGCSALKQIKFPETIDFSMDATALDGTAYYNAQENWWGSALYGGKYLIAGSADAKGAIEVKEGTLKVMGYAFRERQITSVSFPASLRRINYGAFYKCSGLESASFQTEGWYFTITTGKNQQEKRYITSAQNAAGMLRGGETLYFDEDYKGE